MDDGVWGYVVLADCGAAPVWPGSALFEWSCVNGGMSITFRYSWTNCYCVISFIRLLRFECMQLSHMLKLSWPSCGAIKQCRLLATQSNGQFDRLGGPECPRGESGLTVTMYLCTSFNPNFHPHGQCECGFVISFL